MVVNFRARGISRGARKLARTPTLNLKKKKKKLFFLLVFWEKRIALHWLLSDATGRKEVTRCKHLVISPY